MTNRAAGSVVLAALLAVGARVTFAAQHTLPTTLFLVRNPSAGSDPTKRTVVFRQEEKRSASGIVGDPTVSGATLRVSLAEGGDQCFDLPAFAWSRVGMLGFKYHNLGGPGAVTSAAIDKEEFTGDLILKWKLRGSHGPINVVPVPGNPGFAVNFQIGDGDDYCAGGATPSGGTTTDIVYQVRNLPPPPACGVAACSPSAAFVGVIGAESKSGAEKPANSD
jgi:hypothetical protein